MQRSLADRLLYQVILIHMDRINKQEFVKQLVRKMAPPLGEPFSGKRVSSCSKLTVARSNIGLIGARGAVGGIAQHQPDPAKATRRALVGAAHLLLQVQ